MKFTREDLLAIQTTSLSSEKPLDCDLYVHLPLNDKFVRIRTAGQYLEAEARDNYRKKQADRFFMPDPRKHPELYPAATIQNPPFVIRSQAPAVPPPEAEIPVAAIVEEAPAVTAAEAEKKIKPRQEESKKRPTFQEEEERITAALAGFETEEAAVSGGVVRELEESISSQLEESLDKIKDRVIQSKTDADADVTDLENAEEEFAQAFAITASTQQVIRKVAEYQKEIEAELEKLGEEPPSPEQESKFRAAHERMGKLIALAKRAAKDPEAAKRLAAAFPARQQTKRIKPGENPLEALTKIEGVTEKLQSGMKRQVRGMPEKIDETMRRIAPDAAEEELKRHIAADKREKEAERRFNADGAEEDDLFNFRSDNLEDAFTVLKADEPAPEEELILLKQSGKSVEKEYKRIVLAGAISDIVKTEQEKILRALGDKPTAEDLELFRGQREKIDHMKGMLRILQSNEELDIEANEELSGILEGTLAKDHAEKDLYKVRTEVRGLQEQLAQASDQQAEREKKIVALWEQARPGAAKERQEARKKEARDYELSSYTSQLALLLGYSNKQFIRDLALTNLLRARELAPPADSTRFVRELWQAVDEKIPPPPGSQAEEPLAILEIARQYAQLPQAVTGSLKIDGTLFEKLLDVIEREGRWNGFFTERARQGLRRGLHPTQTNQVFEIASEAKKMADKLRVDA